MESELAELKDRSALDQASCLEMSDNIERLSAKLYSVSLELRSAKQEQIHAAFTAESRSIQESQTAHSNQAKVLSELEDVKGRLLTEVAAKLRLTKEIDEFEAQRQKLHNLEISHEKELANLSLENALLQEKLNHALASKVQDQQRLESMESTISSCLKSGAQKQDELDRLKDDLDDQVHMFQILSKEKDNGTKKNSLTNEQELNKELKNKVAAINGELDAKQIEIRALQEHQCQKHPINDDNQDTGRYCDDTIGTDDPDLHQHSTVQRAEDVVNPIEPAAIGGKHSAAIAVLPGALVEENRKLAEALEDARRTKAELNDRVVHLSKQLSDMKRRLSNKSGAHDAALNIKLEKAIQFAVSEYNPAIATTRQKKSLAKQLSMTNMDDQVLRTAWDIAQKSTVNYQSSSDPAKKRIGHQRTSSLITPWKW
uniref:Uncharacterized protein n=1 Tax=Spongospora subterranea TaxID=70186 RepID=A0A0H5QMB1_9EUKA|eukprot:CRZ03138.1 hypothetical protein [Spongospora subterranea]